MTSMEEEKPKSEANEVRAAENSASDNKPKRKQGDTKPIFRSRHSCLRILGCLFAVVVIIIATLAYLVIAIAAPTISAVDKLPKDFPKELVLYELDQAKISVQTPESKQRILKLLNSLPEWALTPFLGYLAPDLKTQVAASLKNPADLTKNLTAKDLSGVLSNTSSNALDTISLEWNNINKSKEELYDYYKKQLAATGFTVKDNMSDYEIDLSFFKTGISGAMSIADNFKTDNSSAIKMTVDYLSKNAK